MADCGTRINWSDSMVAGSLTIDGVLLHRPAFAVLDVRPLWTGPTVRGADLEIPGWPGVVSMPRRATARSVSLPMLIEGRVDPAGNPYDNPLEGLLLNIEWLRTYVTGPTYLTDGTRYAVLSIPGGGGTREGYVTVEGLEVGGGPVGMGFAVLDLTLPNGTLSLTTTGPPPGPDPDPDPDPPPGSTLFGVNLIGGSFPATYAFEDVANFPTGIILGGTTGTAGRMQCLRIFGGASNNTALADRAMNARSGSPTGFQNDTPIMLSCTFASDPATTDATLIAYLQAVQAIAVRRAPGTPFYLAMDPEPDRTDRSYTPAEFATMLGRITTLAATHAPDVTWVLNLTGYLFSSRIGDFWPACSGMFDVLAVDPYWQYGVDSSGTEASVGDAHAFAAANSLRFAIGEWGVERSKGPSGIGDPTNQGEWVAHVVDFFRSFSSPSIEIASYFESGECRLIPDGYADEYGEAVRL